MIVDRGRAFDFLAWYRPLTIVTALAERPIIEWLRGEFLWRLEAAGMCSPAHFKRIGFEKIGTYAIDEWKLRREFSIMQPGIYAAINDISIANRIGTTPSFNVKFLTNPAEMPSGVARYRSIRSLAGIQRM